MEGKVDYQESQTNGDEEVDVDEEDGVADQAEYAGWEDEGQKPEAASESGEPVFQS